MSPTKRFESCLLNSEQDKLKFSHLEPLFTFQSHEKTKVDYKCNLCAKDTVISSGVFSTGATGAIAPVLLRKRLIAPAILHLPYSVI